MYSILLEILKDKANHARFVPYVKDHVVPSEVSLVIKEMGKFFDARAVSEIDWEEFIPWFKLNKIASLSKEKHAIYDKLFEQLQEKHDDAAKKRVLEDLVEKDFAVRMADHLLKVSEGDESKCVLDTEDMLREFKSETDMVSSIEDEFVTDDAEVLLKDDRGDGLNWRLEELNVSAGPIRKGDFIVVGAAVNVGKTTFLASEVSHMATQLEDDQDVLWFNNEEEGTKVKKRVWQSALGWTWEELHDNPVNTVAELQKVWGRIDKVKLKDDKSITAAKIESILEQSNPGLIIFDQLYKVFGFTDVFSEYDKQIRLFGWARELAHKYAPVITVHQADGTAVGEYWPNQHQLYNSRVGVQGEADLILTIGQDLDPTAGRDMFDRGLNVAKNKLVGGPKTIEKERHAKWEVEIDPSHARYKSGGTI